MNIFIILLAVLVFVVTNMILQNYDNISPILNSQANTFAWPVIGLVIALIVYSIVNKQNINL